MKIEDAWIDDPTLYGEIAPAQMVVQVNELPSITIPWEDFPGAWEVSKFGPFVCFRHNGGTEVGAGDFNVRFRGRFPVVVDITLSVGPAEEHFETFSLPLTRARQLLRKYQPDWQFAISDHAAQKGHILWVPAEMNPSCRHWLGEKETCGHRPVTFVRNDGVDYPLCLRHKRAFNTHAAERRATTSK